MISDAAKEIAAKAMYERLMQGINHYAWDDSTNVDRDHYRAALDVALAALRETHAIVPREEPVQTLARSIAAEGHSCGVDNMISVMDPKEPWGDPIGEEPFWKKYGLPSAIKVVERLEAAAPQGHPMTGLMDEARKAARLESVQIFSVENSAPRNPGDDGVLTTADRIIDAFLAKLSETSVIVPRECKLETAAAIALAIEEDRPIAKVWAAMLSAAEAKP